MALAHEGVRCHHTCRSRLSEHTLRGRRHAARCCRAHAKASEHEPGRASVLRRGAPTHGCGTSCACHSGPGRGSTAALCGSPGPPPHALRARVQLFFTVRSADAPLDTSCLARRYAGCVSKVRSRAHHEQGCHDCLFRSKAVCALQAVSRSHAAREHGQSLSGERVVQRPHHLHKLIKHDVAQGSRATPEGT